MKPIAVSDESGVGTPAPQRRRVLEGSSRSYVAPEIETLQRVILRRPSLELRRLVFPRQDGEK